MARLSQRATDQRFAAIPELVSHPQKGLETAPVIEKLESLYDTLNQQANQLDEWREHVIQLLTKQLVDEDDDAEITGEEFVDSTALQEELMVYVQVLRSAIADRQDAINGQTNELVKHETAVAKRLAMDGDGPAPEKLLELLRIRESLKPTPNQGSFRGAIAELRGLDVKLGRWQPGENDKPSRARLEYEIVATQIKVTQAQLSAHNKAATAINQEIDQFTTAMNARLEYYRQLQAVSDSVAPYEGPKTDATMAGLMENEETLRKKLNIAESKHRYRKFTFHFWTRYALIT
jgi:E3 ubiquitin-protein ligase SHPRH